MIKKPTSAHTGGPEAELEAACRWDSGEVGGATPAPATFATATFTETFRAARSGSSF